MPEVRIRFAGVFRLAMAPPLFLALLASCDGGTAGENPGPSRLSRVEVAYSETAAWPGRYQLEIGAFGADGESVLSRMAVEQASDLETRTYALPLPEGTKSVSTFLSRQGVPFLILANASVEGSADTLRVPLGTVRLATTARVEAQVFASRCVQCHGASAGTPAAGLDLTAGRALAHLRGVPSQNSSKLLLVAGDTASSFLWEVVRKRNQLIASHGAFSLDAEDLVLLSTWIEKGFDSSALAAGRAAAGP